MYTKLILRNVKRSAQNYIIYMITLTICVAMFYAFLSVSSGYYNTDVSQFYNLESLDSGMKYAVCSVALLIAILIHYVNKFIIIQKQKEFGLQTLMGMEKRTVSRLFFYETLLMGILSIAAGIGFGIVLSQFIHGFLLTSFHQPFQFVFALYPDTSVFTAGFFVITLTAVSLFNVKTISKLQVIDMLRAGKENDKDMRKSKFMPVITFIFSVSLVLMLYSAFDKAQTHFKYDSRFPLPVQMMFYGNIAAPIAGMIVLVTGGIQKLKKKFIFSRFLTRMFFVAVVTVIFASLVPMFNYIYSMTFDQSELGTYFRYLLTGTIFLISTFFYLAGDWFLKRKESPGKQKYQNENLFFYGQISTKLKTTTKSMTFICITLVASICIFMAVPILSGWALGYLDKRCVFDLQADSTYNNVYEEENLADTNFEIMSEYLREHNIKMKEDVEFSTYLPIKEQFRNRVKFDMPALAISLSDYNSLRRMIDLEPISLSENEFTTQWEALASESKIDEFLSEHSTLKTDAGVLSLAKQSSHQVNVSEGIYNAYSAMVYVLPDKISEKLLPVEQHRYITTEHPLSYHTAKELEETFNKFYSNSLEEDLQIPNQPAYYYRSRTVEESDLKVTMFLLQSAMLYGAVVLLVICFTMLALQQLLDAMNFKYRFQVLRKLGVEEKQINKLVTKQLLVWFALPVSAAILCAFIFLSCYGCSIIDVIRAYIGGSVLLGQIGAIGTILIVLLICYFLTALNLFKRTIR